MIRVSNITYDLQVSELDNYWDLMDLSLFKYSYWNISSPPSIKQFALREDVFASWIWS